MLNVFETFPWLCYAMSSEKSPHFLHFSWIYKEIKNAVSSKVVWQDNTLKVISKKIKNKNKKVKRAHKTQSIKRLNNKNNKTPVK